MAAGEQGPSGAGVSEDEGRAPAAARVPAQAQRDVAPAGRRPSRPGPGSGAGALLVREGEARWTEQELAGVRAALGADAGRLRTEISDAEVDIADLLRDSGDGAGDDQADAGTKTFEREHELSVANNARDMLAQSERALERIDAGTYGACESCANPVGKARLQAFPRATLCVTCKQREERR